MATSGYTDVAVTSWDTLRFSWWEIGKSIEHNETEIAWQLLLIAGSSGRISSSASKSWSVNVNGNYYSGTNTVGISNNSTKILASGTTVIPHNDDGSKSFGYSFSQQFSITFSGSSIGTVSGSGVGELNYIARASTPSLSGTMQIGNTITINTNRASGNFIHNLYYSWGPIANQRFATGIGASATWTIPKDLANYIPNGTSGTGTIICETYNGSSLIGTKSISFTATVPDTAEFKPSISEIALSEAVSGIFEKFGTYIQNQSKAYCTITASGAYSSTIKSYKAIVNGATYNEKAFTTDFLKLAGVNSVVVTVTDSRGRTATLTRDFEVLAYEGPSITKFLVNRCNEDGTLNDEGEYSKIEIAATIPSLNSKNTYSYNLQYKDTDDSSYTQYAVELTEETTETEINISGSVIIAADSNNSFEYMIMVADTFISVNKVRDIGTAFQLFNWNASGRGFAIGKVSEKNAFEVNMDIYDKFGQLINNGLADYGWGNIDPNTTLSTLCLTETNTPNENGFYYVMTMFYAEKTETARRTQIAIPYIYDITQNKKDIYIRQYVDGEWNEWYSPSKGKVLYNNEAGVSSNSFELSDYGYNYKSIKIAVALSGHLKRGRHYIEVPINYEDDIQLDLSINDYNGSYKLEYPCRATISGKTVTFNFNMLRYCFDTVGNYFVDNLEGVSILEAIGYR